MTFKNKIKLSIILIFVLTISIVILVIYPLFSEIKKYSGDYVSQKVDMLSLETKIDNLKQFQATFPEINPNLEKIDLLFIDAKVPVEFIKFLEQTSQNYGISIEVSSSLSAKTKQDPWPVFIFRISSVGSFANFMKFFERIELSPYLITVQDLNIVRLTETELKAKGSEKLSLGDIRANFSLRVYTK